MELKLLQKDVAKICGVSEDCITRRFGAKTVIEPKKNKEGGIDVEGEVLIGHRPTNFNYWQVQFAFKDYKGDEMPEVKQSIVKNY